MPQVAKGAHVGFESFRLDNGTVEGAQAFPGVVSFLFKFLQLHDVSRQPVVIIVRWFAQSSTGWDEKNSLATGADGWLNRRCDRRADMNGLHPYHPSLSHLGQSRHLVPAGLRRWQAGDALWSRGLRVG